MMRLTILANAAISPIIKPLLALSPHKIELHILSTIPHEARCQLRQTAQNAYESDGIILLDGMDLLADGWYNGEVPLIIPRVHNIAGLILGDDETYRQLYRLYDGGICWFLPGARREYSPTSEEDCQALCALTCTQINLPDEALLARTIAQYHEWDYLEHQCDLTLLESLLGGEWDEEIIFTPGAFVTA